MYNIFQALNCGVSKLFLNSSRENQLTVFSLWIFLIFNNAHFHIYFSWELTILWLNQIISLSKSRSYKNNNSNMHHNIYYSYISEFWFCYNFFFHNITILYYLFFNSSWEKILDKLTNMVNPNSQPLSLNAPDSSSSDPQTSSAIESTTISVPYIRDKNQNNSVLYSQKNIQNDASITNNGDIKSCKKAKN